MGEPAATEVHPLIESPIRPVPRLFGNTVGEPTAIGAAWGGQIGAGNKCVVLLSPCLETGILFAKTLGDPSALDIPEQ